MPKNIFLSTTTAFVRVERRRHHPFLGATLAIKTGLANAVGHIRGCESLATIDTSGETATHATLNTMPQVKVAGGKL